MTTTALDQERRAHPRSRAVVALAVAAVVGLALGVVLGRATSPNTPVVATQHEVRFDVGGQADYLNLAAGPIGNLTPIGYSATPVVLQGPSAAVVTIRAQAGATVICRIVVDGQRVAEQIATDQQSATCLWVGGTS